MPSAGEVEQFAYCAHNWFLARQGHDPGGEGSRHGMAVHNAKGLAQEEVRRYGEEVRTGFRWSMAVLAAAGSVTFLTLVLVYLRGDPLYWVFLTTSLVLVSASAGLWVVAVEAQRRASEARKRGGLVPGEVVDSDLTGQGRILEDHEWGLTGRPDTVMRTAHGFVPVEVKGGRTPERPFESHVLQLGCYLHLLEATTGERPQYGLLNYPEGVFRVGWDEDLRGRLRTVLDRMAAAEQAGKADRDHHHAGRCRGCARRDFCDQRLV